MHHSLLRNVTIAVLCFPLPSPCCCYAVAKHTHNKYVTRATLSSVHLTLRFTMLASAFSTASLFPFQVQLSLFQACRPSCQQIRTRLACACHRVCIRDSLRSKLPIDSFSAVCLSAWACVQLIALLFRIFVIAFVSSLLSCFLRFLRSVGGSSLENRRGVLASWEPESCNFRIFDIHREFCQNSFWFSQFQKICCKLEFC